jgi:Cu+-exporting ATPase
LCLPVFIVGCLHFGKSAFNSVKGGVPNMDVLIFIGSTAAFVYSLVGTLQHLGEQYQFYETCATIITLVLLGNLFRETLGNANNISGKRPDEVPAGKSQSDSERRHRSDQRQRSAPGDTLLVNTGDKIPLMERYWTATPRLMKAMLTGESVPVTKEKYDSVIGGTILQSGNIRMLATKVGSTRSGANYRFDEKSPGRQATHSKTGR